MNNQLQKAINIVLRTGDRLVVVNENSDESYVIMNLDEYEKLTRKEKKTSNLTEEKLVDKINRDISLWKSQQNDEEQAIEDKINSYLEDTNESYNFNNEFQDNFQFNQEVDVNKNKKKQWTIPKNIKLEAEEIIDEDMQYLEGVPF